ncbi:MAG: carboxymuconolactone decarboxylase family protein [Burkholderiaceae bacterium]
MSERIDYLAQNPELFRKYYEFSQTVKKGGIEESLVHLVNVRASQLNGCAFCVDMHIKQARLDGERELRLHHVAIWRESPLFGERERAALEWTEVMTHIPAQGVPDDLYARMLGVFSEKELVDLNYCVMLINGWNRLNVPFRAVPGSKDKEFGLLKANLA